jgi:hypothetical protein
VQSKALVVAVLLALGFVPSGQAAPRDAAARGLDLFIQAPGEVPSGATLPVQVRVFGFPTVATLAPLAGATVEATWDPESLGEKVSKVPPPVSIVCDGAGRGHLDIEVPPGRGALKLLVAARFAGHERTHTLDVKRTTRYGLELQTSDTSVVPGGALSAWVLLRDRTNGRPVGGKAVDLALKEGSRMRFSRRLTTDRAGTASAEVRVPFAEEPETTWTLLARTAMGQGDEAEAEATLSVREETPQAPSLKVQWTKAQVRPGAPATFTLAVRDGTGLGIAKLPLRYWVGPKGTAAPKNDKAWLRGSIEICSDPAPDHLAARLELDRGREGGDRGGTAHRPGHDRAGHAGPRGRDLAGVRRARTGPAPASLPARDPGWKTHRRRAGDRGPRSARERAHQRARLWRGALAPACRGGRQGARASADRLRRRGGRDGSCPLAVGGR